VQGVFVETEVLAQLEKIGKHAQKFDAVCILRGGGGKLDLAAFDSLELSMAAAKFPLPILTGIGHDVDETVLDLVAHTCLKTPTAVADFILHHNLGFETEVLNLGMALKNISLQKLKESELRLSHCWQMIDFQAKGKLRQQKMMLDYIEKEIPGALRNRFSKEKIRLEGLEKSVHSLSPETVLKRGFSIVMKEGKIITDASQTKPGDEVEVTLYRGAFTGTVKKLKDE
jgi:exodeoxyribonuclease VII large subunit